MAKILLVSHIFPPSVDGGSKVIAQLGGYLQKNGHQILALTSDCRSTDDFVTPSSQLPSFTSDPDIIRLPVYRHLRRPLKLFSFLLPKNSYLRHTLEICQKGPVFRLLPFIKAFRRILAFRPELIVAGPLPTTIVLYARLLQSLTKAKLLINASFHPTDPAFHSKPLTAALKKSDYIWGLTDSEANYFHDNFQIDRSKIITAGNGTDTQLLPDNHKPHFPTTPNLLFIGSFAAHKGIGTLVDAFVLLLDKYPNLTLTLAGQPTLYSPQIYSQISKLPAKFQDQIKIITNFPDSQLPDLVDSCSVLVLPSAQESFGLVLLEAWARQKPVVTSDIPALAELVAITHGGLTFKLHDAVDLSNQIDRLLTSDISLKLHGLNGHRFVKNHYTWDKIVTKLWTAIFS